MGRLLILGQRESLLPALLAGMYPDHRIVHIRPGDPLAETQEDWQEIRLLLLDLGLDEGYATAQVKAARRRLPHCPILVVYPQDKRSVAAAAVVAGADALLPEPFLLEEFSALVKRHMAHGIAVANPLTDTEPTASPARAVKHRATVAHTITPSALAEPEPTASNADHGGEETRIADLDALSLFVRGLAHEVNNPLTTIRGFLQLFLHNDKAQQSDPDAMEAFRTMESESTRIAEVISELEYFTGLRRPSRTPVDLPHLLRDALKASSLPDVIPVLKTNDLSLLADREQLSLAMRHLFGYLVSTAKDAKPDLTVEVDRREDIVSISVEGSCASAAATTPHRLLVPLYAGQNGERGKRRSLACVFGIARAHQGTFHVRRLTENRLLFRLDLPAHREPTSAH